MKFFIKTYGCQMNERDSDAVAALLEEQGYARAQHEADAELVLVNTCSVRAKAEAKALGKLGLLSAPNRQSGRPRIVGAIGCMTERLGSALFDKVPHLHFAVPPHRLDTIPEIVAQLRQGAPQTAPPPIRGARTEPALSGHAVCGVSAFVNVLYGCNRGCTYCIVPTVRGRERSRPALDILQELKQLAARGVRDVTLLGQSVMSYGRTEPTWPADVRSPGGYREPFVRLLEAACRVDGLERIRFTSGHPSGCTPELVRAMRDLPALCPHLHLPLQSGANRILEAMRRGYTADEYRRAVRHMRAAVPALALTTDIIVGFPSETLAEFEATRAFMDEIGFDSAFIFKYSPRPGTVAAGWPDDVAAEEKRRRNQQLLEDQNRRALALNQKMAGHTLAVLAEGPSPRNPKRWTGRTATNKIVVFEPDAALDAGDMVPVHIVRAQPQTLYGELARPGAHEPPAKPPAKKATPA